MGWLALFGEGSDRWSETDDGGGGNVMTMGGGARTSRKLLVSDDVSNVER